MSATNILRCICCFRPLTSNCRLHLMKHFPRNHINILGVSKPFHTTVSQNFLDARDQDHEQKEKQLIVRKGNIFDEAAKKARDKKTFQQAVSKYLKQDSIYRRGHVEFIYAALTKMEEFRVHKDLDTYKKLLILFPKGKMIPRSAWQVEWMHYPKQQQCCIDVLDQMEFNGVVPDDEMGYQLLEIFGKHAHAFRKYQRMMYWMPKFKHMNPYLIPYHLPEDPTELARLALQRMAVDLENKISVFQSNELDSFIDDTFIVSAQSPKQQKLVEELPTDRAVFVEGGFMVWLRDKSQTYFILRAETTSTYIKSQEQGQKEKEEDSFLSWNPFTEEKPADLVVAPSVHEQDDGTILAMCITGTATKDSLMSWIKHLQNTNPRLAEVPVVFSLRSPEGGLQIFKEEDDEESELAVSH